MGHTLNSHLFSSNDITNIRSKLLQWFSKAKRDLPWRKPFETLDSELQAQRAYEVWVSEIMLQQTQVATVIPYFNKWMDAFPTVEDLANSDIERVNQLWSGLGYYTRARNLHKGADIVVNEFNGKLPNTVDGLLKIPGIGPYTAGAIASIAFNQPAAIADGNVFRVLSRLKAVYANSKSSAASKLFWKMAKDLVDAKEPGDFNQAMMELGATVCTPRNPTCEACPLQKECMVYNKGFPIETDIEDPCSICQKNDNIGQLTPNDYPPKPERKKQAEQCKTLIYSNKDVLVMMLEQMIENNRYFLVVQRDEDSGVHVGLWDFPLVFIEEDQFHSDTGYSSRINPSIQELLTLSSIPTWKPVGKYTHIFSHIKRHMKAFHWILNEENNVLEWKAMNGTQCRWVKEEELLNESAVPTTLKRVHALLSEKKVTKKKRPVNENVPSIASFFTSSGNKKMKN